MLKLKIKDFRKFRIFMNGQKNKLLIVKLDFYYLNNNELKLK